MTKAFKTSHNLSFEITNHSFHGKLFRVGTCHGQWDSTDHEYCIISIANTKPGNGHTLDVYEWFENSAKRDGKNLLVLEFLNDRYKNHLIEKQGFKPIGEEHVIKVFNLKAYKRLLKHGNEYLTLQNNE